MPRRPRQLGTNPVRRFARWDNVRFRASFWLAALVGVLLIAATADVVGDSARWLGFEGPGCFARRALDISCPGCGLTRGVASVVQGNLHDAWSFHPASLPVTALVLVGIPIQLYVLCTGRLSERVQRGSRWGRWALVVALFTAWCFEHWL